MSKLSISQQGIQVETHEKTNVMSPYHTMAFIVIGGSVSLMLFGPQDWIKGLGAITFLLFITVWIVIYCTHSIKKPELLQSETYRLELHKIEAGMLEAKPGNTLGTTADLSIETNQVGETTLILTDNLLTEEEEN